MKVLVVHGPNLNLLGTRELSVYGDATLDEVNEIIENEAGSLGIEVEIHQTVPRGRDHRAPAFGHRTASTARS